MLYDALIVGGSHAGLAGAMQVARSGRPVCVLDGRQPRNRFAAHSHGVFAQDGHAPHDMIARARADLAAYPNVTLVDTRAVRAQRDADALAVTLATGDTLHAQRLLLAFGVVDVLPGLPGLAERWGRSVLHCPYCHGYEVRGRQLGVLYAGEASVHQALLVSDWGPVTLFLDGHPAPGAAAQANLASRGVTLEPCGVAGVEGELPALESVRLRDGRRHPVDALFVTSRLALSSDLATQLGCELEDGPQGPLIRTDASRQTTVAGVFAAGDITPRGGNVSMSIADGVFAGVSLHQSLIFGPLAALERAAPA